MPQEPVLKVEILPRTCGDIGEIHEIVSKKHAVYVKLAKFLAKMTEILAPKKLPKCIKTHIQVSVIQNFLGWKLNL